MPRLASVRRQTGTRIQNWAERTGLKLGNIWMHNRRQVPQPYALACSTGLALRMRLTAARTTRAPEAQPTPASIRNRVKIETNGGMLSGRRARKVSSANSQGSDRNKSDTALATWSTQPPK